MDLVAAMASFGAAGIDGELDGDRGELRLDLGFPTPNQERERGEKGGQVEGSKWASSAWSLTTRETRHGGMGVGQLGGMAPVRHGATVAMGFF